MTRTELEHIIKKYVPDGTEKYVVELLSTYKIQLKLSKPRLSKYGDYRSPYGREKNHRISVNKDLNPFNFLLTFLHEVAHLTAFEKFGHRIIPHGKEWKNEFKILLEPVASKHLLPDDVLDAILQYMNDPSASSCSDAHLSKVLSNYDKDERVLLETLPIGSKFILDSGKMFIKGKKLRTWFQCIEADTKKEYRVSGISKVYVLE